MRLQISFHRIQMPHANVLASTGGKLIFLCISPLDVTHHATTQDAQGGFGRQRCPRYDQATCGVVHEDPLVHNVST
eukprot:Skav202209  [mRNA]  locus=scaffold5327:55827:60999:+ [translate_table: standard]